MPDLRVVTARYLRGELEAGSLWLRRVHEDGREELLGSFAHRR